MRIKDPHAEEEEPYNLVPLTDMVFNLLIFFMCATTFAQVEKDLSVQLPGPASFKPLSAVSKQIIINIEKDGTIQVDGKTVDNKQLAVLIAEAVSKDANATVVVRADERGVMGYFQNVVRICRQNGISETRIVYTDSGPGT